MITLPVWYNLLFSPELTVAFLFQLGGSFLYTCPVAPSQLSHAYRDFPNVLTPTALFSPPSFCPE